MISTYIMKTMFTLNANNFHQKRRHFHVTKTFRQSHAILFKISNIDRFHYHAIKKLSENYPVDKVKKL